MLVQDILNYTRQVETKPAARVRFALACAAHRKLFLRLSHASPKSALGQEITQRPMVLGILIWPYQCSAWNADTRVERLTNHYECIDHNPKLQFATNDKIVLADLGHISDGARIILDQPKWFIREGSLALNLFIGNFRAFSVAFSLHSNKELACFIGGIQGRNSESSLDLYRQLTKDFHGLRPRDLLLNLLRMLAVSIGASRIEAVADNFRYFRHPYFGGKHPGAMKINYDEIWQERGGIKIAETHFELPIAAPARDLGEVRANKRSMYRKRYAMLDELALAIDQGLASHKIEHFIDT